jgi:hypothetical protein
MSNRVTIHVADLVDSPHAGAHDSSDGQMDIVSVDFDLRTGMQGTLAEMLTVIGRAHEQLLAIQAERQAAEATDA